MARERGKSDAGDSVTGKTVHCVYRKSDKERLIRRTGAHRGRSVCLHHATCTVMAAYEQGAPEPEKQYESY